MASSPDHIVHGANHNARTAEWKPFEFHEPKFGTQVHGETQAVRTFGKSGKLFAGFWRTGLTSPGTHSDGTHEFLYSAQSGDTINYVIEGFATLTISSTNEQHHIRPGSVVITPKKTEVHWKIDAPFFKTFLLIWDGTKTASHPLSDVQVQHVDNVTTGFQDYRYHEPNNGPLVAGELHYLQDRGSSGTMLSGLWRGGKGIAGSNVDNDGKLSVPYTAVLGDETIFLLEGEVEIVDKENNVSHTFTAGDIIGLTTGMDMQWISKGPFARKLWVITEDRTV